MIHRHTESVCSLFLDFPFHFIIHDDDFSWWDAGLFVLVLNLRFLLPPPTRVWRYTLVVDLSREEKKNTVCELDRKVFLLLFFSPQNQNTFNISKKRRKYKKIYSFFASLVSWHWIAWLSLNLINPKGRNLIHYRMSNFLVSAILSLCFLSATLEVVQSHLFLKKCYPLALV